MPEPDINIFPKFSIAFSELLLIVKFPDKNFNAFSFFIAVLTIPLEIIKSPLKFMLPRLIMPKSPVFEIVISAFDPESKFPPELFFKPFRDGPSICNSPFIVIVPSLKIPEPIGLLTIKIAPSSTVNFPVDPISIVLSLVGNTPDSCGLAGIKISLFVTGRLVQVAQLCESV